MGHGFAALSLPIGICTYLMTRVLGAFNKVYSRWAAGFCSALGCGTKTGGVITHKTLSSTFLAMDTIAYRAMAGTLCTNSCSYSISYPVPLLTSLLIKLAIEKVS